MSKSLWPHGLHHASLPCPSPPPVASSNSCPSHWWCHPTISLSVVTFSSHLQSFPVSGSFPTSWFFASGDQSIGVLASTLSFQWILPLGWTGWISLPARDSQDSSPTPQFKSINSSVLGFIYSPILTSIHDYWKNHSFDHMDLCWQSNVCFLICCWGCS